MNLKEEKMICYLMVNGTSVSFMPGFILDTASAVGDRFVICSSVSTDVEPAGPVFFKFS